jgi:hypothetical protein
LLGEVRLSVSWFNLRIFVMNSCMIKFHVRLTAFVLVPELSKHNIIAIRKIRVHTILSFSNLVFFFAYAAYPTNIIAISELRVESTMRVKLGCALLFSVTNILPTKTVTEQWVTAIIRFWFL